VHFKNLFSQLNCTSLFKIKSRKKSQILSILVLSLDTFSKFFSSFSKKHFFCLIQISNWPFNWNLKWHFFSYLFDLKQKKIKFKANCIDRVSHWKYFALLERKYKKFDFGEKKLEPKFLKLTHSCYQFRSCFHDAILKAR